MRDWKNFYELTNVKSLNDFNREEDLKNVVEEFYSKFYLNLKFKAHNQNNIKEVLSNPDLENVMNRDLTKALCKPSLFKNKNFECAHIYGDVDYHTKRIESSNIFLDWLLNRYNIDLTTEISFDYDEELITGIVPTTDLTGKRFSFSVGEMLFYYCIRNYNFERAEQFKHYLKNFDRFQEQVLSKIRELEFYLNVFEYEKFKNIHYNDNKEVYNELCEYLKKLIVVFNDKNLFKNGKTYYRPDKPTEPVYIKNIEEAKNFVRSIIEAERLEEAKYRVSDILGLSREDIDTYPENVRKIVDDYVKCKPQWWGDLITLLKRIKYPHREFEPLEHP